MDATAAPAIQARALSKAYGALTALAEAEFSVRAGEVRALVGSNGAGKSTLIKILTGAVAPTSGSVEIGGEPVPLGSPTEMMRRGVACIYQHSNLAPAMSVLDNIFLGRQPTRRGGLLDRKRQRREALALLKRHGIEIDLDAAAGTLPTVKQKEVEILKALALDARVLLMDEPTGWLSAVDVARLHTTIRSLKARGVAIVYVSHMLDEIYKVCDTLTVMRDGRVIASAPVGEIARPRLVELMVGEKLARDSADAAQSQRKPRGTGEVRLRCSQLGQRGVFRDISFELHAGEILCITGLIGAKRTELLHTLFGSARFDAGTLELDGARVAFHDPAQAIARGVGFATEDRHREGLMLGLSVSENLIMSTLGRFRRGLLLALAKIDESACRSIAELNVQPPDGRQLVRLLSGGNQQKVLLGKWLKLGPRVLLLDEPTVGVDVGAKAEIYSILRAERDKGTAILVVSSDLEEVMTIADRIAVMVSGRMVSMRDAGATTQAELVRDIGGVAA